MKKLYSLFIFLVLASAVTAQPILVLHKVTFDDGVNPFDFTSGGVGSNTGNNSWIVNNVYSGGGIYPDTPPQDSLAPGGGQIDNGPNSTYLHIHDSVAAVANCSWNTNNSSDRFTFLGNPFCTLGMTDVTFTFFWICEGDTNAYGEVYYKKDGGPWTKTGQAKYYNASKWTYEIIQDPAFENVQNLQLGFRWVNAPSGVASNVSFGIDDIIAVGNYDNVNHPVTLTVSSISPLTVCQGDYLILNYALSEPLCVGTYRIEMSDRNGNFTNPYNGGVFSIFAPDTSGGIGFQTPSDSAGTCFRVRIVRTEPPFISTSASVCFTIQDCPESIFTSAAPVMTDLDTACILSVIDVKFYSFGVFGPGSLANIYTAQLSDTNGSFATPFTLGTLPSDLSYGGPPGNISGLIPQGVPPGCGYYIRVISNHPSTIGTLIGPFCLVRCDELTNNHTDIHFCLQSGPYDLCEPLVVHPNEWTSQANYDTCNDWTIELRSMMDFSLVNSGGLGVYHDSLGGNFTLCVPSVKDSLPVAPGAYYMRMVSDCSNLVWNQTGSVIRVTIGAPDTIPPVIILPDSVACNVGIVEIWVNPFNHPPSDYEWACSGINNGNAFIWQYNPLLVDFTGANVDDYFFTVREINFGCYGPYSDRATLAIITSPSVNIKGDTTICLGDTVPFSVGYLKDTYYNWDVPSGVQMFNESNSQAQMIFDSVGTFTISNFSLNDCGSDSNTYTVHVKTLYHVDLGPDKSSCVGTPLQLNAQIDPVDKVFTTKDSTTTAGNQGAMFNIIAHSDVMIDSFAVRFMATPLTVVEEIYGKTGSYRTFEQQPLMWNLLGSYFGINANPPSQFTILPINVHQAIAANDTFAFYVTTANTTPVKMQYSPGQGITQGTVYKSDGVIDFVQGTVNAYSFGAFIGPRVLNVRIYYTTKAGIKYLWNTGDSTSTIVTNPALDTLYSVLVYDTSGCKNFDTVLVTLKPSPAVNAGNDLAMCDGETGQLNGSSSVSQITWTPSTGLNNNTITNPVFNYNQSVQYQLIATDTNGCSKRDTVDVTVHPLPTADAGLDSAFCAGTIFNLSGVSNADTVLWSPATGLDNANILNPLFTSLVSVHYTLYVTDSFNCKNQDDVLIKVGRPPFLNAGPDTLLCNDDEYIFPAATDGQNYSWTYVDGQSYSANLNPTIVGNDSGEFVIIAFDTIGCSATDTVIITRHNCEIYLKIAQAFTPNGDGHNDHFTIFAQNLTEFEIKIYNRWGELVYSSNNLADLNDLSRGWDGTYKGALQELGTFAYYAHAVDIHGKKIDRKGNITLVR